MNAAGQARRMLWRMVLAVGVGVLPCVHGGVARAGGHPAFSAASHQDQALPSAPESAPESAPALGEGLRASPQQFAPSVLTVPGESMLIDPPASALQVLPEIPDVTPLPDQEGIASWYGLRFHGRKTASGERFDRNALTAAHPTLPFGVLVCVRSQLNGKFVVVRINDRGPHVPNRIIDLSEAAAKSIGMHSGLGLKSVELFTLEPGETECPAGAP